MLTFLFWNVKRNPLERVVASLAMAHDVDVLVLAESPLPHAHSIKDSSGTSGTGFQLAPSMCTRLAVYTRFSNSLVVPVKEASTFTIRRVELPLRPGILMAAAHLPSKLRWRDESQPFEAVEFARVIRQAEMEVGHRRTVVLGDLNMNPYEPGLLAAPSLNATMTRQVASKGARKVQGKVYPYFFNPMWGLFNDGARGVPGTYYRASSEHVTAFWNMFDQVLVRPDLLGRFRTESVRILTTDGGARLLNKNGIPNASEFSDHLPIVFQLDV